MCPKTLKFSKILLDTSYLLPYASIQVENWTPQNLLKLLKSNSQKIFYVKLSIFEIIAKGSKLIIANKGISLKEIQIGIDSIRFNSRLTSLESYYDPKILDLSVEFRRIHTDFIDCIILASAVCYSDIFCTFDQMLIKKISKSNRCTKKILGINSEFRIQFDDLTKPAIKLIELSQDPK